MEALVAIKLEAGTAHSVAKWTVHVRAESKSPVRQVKVIQTTDVSMSTNLFRRLKTATAYSSQAFQVHKQLYS